MGGLPMEPWVREDENEPRFEAMPLNQLDRFAPVDARQLYDFGSTSTAEAPSEI